MCICENDYYRYIEKKLSIRRYLQLRTHSFVCKQCQDELKSWYVMKTLVRQSLCSNITVSPGIRAGVMDKIHHL